MRVDEYTIELDDSPVFFRRGEGAELPVLYLHGVPTSSDDWIPFLEQTGGVAPDLPGFGRSGKGGHLDYSLEGQAGFVESLLDHLELEQVDLVVHDWGAGGGLTFAQGHPHRVRRLVLIDALPLLPGFTWPPLARRWRTPMLGELLMGSTTRWMFKRTLRRGGPWSDERLDALWQQFDQGTQRAVLRLHRDTPAERLAEAGRHLNLLQGPALVMWGERDPWLAPALADRYAASLPGAALERIPEAGHWPWLDQPGVIDRVAAFLR